MALKPKSIIETAVELGRGAVTRGTELVSRRLREDETDAAPKTPATPAARSTPGGHKSATAKTSKKTPAAKSAGTKASGAKT